MIHIASKSFDLHCARARSLIEWQIACWWMGVVCFALAVGLVLADMVARGFVMAIVYLAIVTAREAFGRAAERELWKLRDELLVYAAHDKGDSP